MPQQFGLVFTPIYRQIGTSLVHEGTAVLVRTTARYWMFSAAHALLTTTGPRWVAAQPNFQLRPATWHGDPLDLAFLELNQAEADALIACGNDFLHAKHIDGGIDDFAGHEMIVTGFPERAVVADDESNIFRVKPNSFHSHFLTYEALKVRRLDPYIHVAGIFKTLKDEDGPIRKIVMKGLSGGGIWIRRSADNVKLVGIAHEYREKKGLLVGTRIRPMLMEMKRRLEAEEISET